MPSAAAWRRNSASPTKNSNNAKSKELREKVESKVAFNVEQGLEVGELEVDRSSNSCWRNGRKNSSSLQQRIKRYQRNLALAATNLAVVVQASCGDFVPIAARSPARLRKTAEGHEFTLNSSNNRRSSPYDPRKSQ